MFLRGIGVDGFMRVTHEVSVQVKVPGIAPELVRVALTGLGVAPADLVEEESRGAHKISIYFPAALHAENLRRAFIKLKLKGVKVGRRGHRARDWATRWKASWRPFGLTRRIFLIPRFLDDVRCPRGRVPLYLDTTSAFGTGLHETTRFSARLIESLRGSFRTALDIGTGTGILAAVALLSGAEHVEAFDIDGEAVKAAALNLKGNGLRCAVLKACDVKSYHSRRKFDLVAANLITHDLLFFKARIISFLNPGGYLILSGISLKSIPLIRKGFSAPSGLKLIKILRGKEWSAFLFVRRS